MWIIPGLKRSERVRSLLKQLRKPLDAGYDRMRRARLKRKIDLTGQAAHDYLRAQIESGRPFMACRFGYTELSKMRAYEKLVAGYRRGRRYDSSDYAKIFKSLEFMSGFFPITPAQVARFYHRMMEDMKEIDVLGSWLTRELDVEANLSGVVRVELHDLDPVIRRNAHPWTSVLRGKRVLVVHPFDRSIRAQYPKRKLLFENPETLPDFELLTLRAVQNPAWNFAKHDNGDRSYHGASREFSDWFEALHHMEREISALEFDIALIGCGAYGLPLAAHVKRMGRQAVHLGGVTQMLFGIKGDRWVKAYGFTRFNEHWVWPLPEETPEESGIVEKCGTYWGGASETL